MLLSNVFALYNLQHSRLMNISLPEVNTYVTEALIRPKPIPCHIDLSIFLGSLRHARAGIWARYVIVIRCLPKRLITSID